MKKLGLTLLPVLVSPKHLKRLWWKNDEEKRSEETQKRLEFCWCKTSSTSSNVQIVVSKEFLVSLCKFSRKVWCSNQHKIYVKI